LRGLASFAAAVSAGAGVSGLSVGRAASIAPKASR
jgi:hypothetical protein